MFSRILLVQQVTIPIPILGLACKKWSSFCKRELIIIFACVTGNKKRNKVDTSNSNFLLFVYNHEPHGVGCVDCERDVIFFRAM